MAVSLAGLAQGKVEGFPYYYQVKWKIFEHRQGGELFRFTLVREGLKQEVEFVEEGGGHGIGAFGWYTMLIVCPVDTLDTRDGLRIVRIEVDPNGVASYL